jgi:hypothetical protein
MATLAAAGVPLIQRDNAGSVVASQTLARGLDVGVFFTDAADLAEQLHDRARMRHLRESLWRQRDVFTFDAHADALVAFLRTVIARAQGASPNTVASTRAPARPSSRSQKRTRKRS